MRKLQIVKSITVCMLACVLLTACATAPVIPPRGLLYTHQRAPLFPGKGAGTKEGRSSAYNILLLVGWGDASIHAAARNGGLVEIHHLDYEVRSFLFIYQRYTTIAYGE